MLRFQIILISEPHTAYHEHFKNNLDKNLDFCLKQKISTNLFLFTRKHINLNAN